MNVRSVNSSLRANSVNSARISSKRSWLQSTRSILFTHTARWLTRRSDAITAWRRLCSTQALAGVDQHEGEVGRRGTGHHVPRVLDVARGVGDDELAARRREVAVRHVDRDALLALGPQAVGEQRQVGVLEALVAARALDGLELVLEDVLALVEQAADEGALAVVDRTGGGEPEQLHQKYPSFLRSSMAASVNLSSARVAPRSVTREAATSVITSSIVIAALSTAPVQLASPTVR